MKNSSYDNISSDNNDSLKKLIAENTDKINNVKIVKVKFNKGLLIKVYSVKHQKD